MLKDDVRTNAYKNAIYQNSHLFRDKVVLDIGCGTGILSMFAAKAGAKCIYAVDMSDIIVQAQKIIDANGFSDKIKLIKGKIEEISLPEKVDIIISEWMGYFLLFEGMLDSVIYARDKFLVPDGLIFPDKAIMYLAAIEDEEYKEEKINFWDDVYGFDYSIIKEIAIREPLVDVVQPQTIVTDTCEIISFDLKTVKLEQLQFTRSFKIRAHRRDYVHALVSWFDMIFSACHKPITLSTSPMTKYTHWKQTIFYMTKALTVAAGEELKGTIQVKPNTSNHRNLDITIQYHFDPQKDSTRESYHETMVYKMC